MDSSAPHRLTASTATGTPALTVVDLSTGGILVEAAEPFAVGAIVHLRLATNHTLCGTFAMRCLHTHRHTGGDGHPVHVSALVFVHPLDEPTRQTLARLALPAGLPPPDNGRHRHLRLASSLTD